MGTGSGVAWDRERKSGSSSNYAIAFAPIISANWNAPDAEEWTVPLGIGISRTTVFNRRPISLGVQYYYNVERPEGSAGQLLRFTVTPLFPTAKH
jgi:hypothetical protein